MSYSMILEIMLPIVAIMTAGFVFGRLRRPNLKPVVEMVMYVTVPCLIMSSILRAPLPAKDFIVMPAAAAFVVAGCGLIMFAVSKALWIKSSPGLYMGSMFMNSGIIAFPLVLSAYGLNALSKAIIYDATNGFLIFSLGVFLLVGRNNVSQVFKIPVIYAIIAAILLNPVSFQIPEVVINTLALVGNSTIPLMLLVLGCRLNSIHLRSFGLSALVSVVRLGGGLLLALLFVRIFGITGTARSVIVLSSSMPTAMNALLLTEEYGVDAELAAGTVMITTLLSFATVPLVMHFLV